MKIGLNPCNNKHFMHTDTLHSRLQILFNVAAIIKKETITHYGFQILILIYIFFQKTKSQLSSQGKGERQ